MDTKRVKQSDNRKAAPAPGTDARVRKEELDLIRKAQAGDQKAIDQLSQVMSGYVRKRARAIAKKYRSSNVASTLSLDDLISVGNIGLLEAIKNFDLNSGYRLLTYASKCITGSILNAFREESKARGGIRPANEEGEEEDRLEDTIEDKRPPKEDQILLGPVPGKDASPRPPRIPPDWTPGQWEREIWERLTKFHETLTSWEAKEKLHLLRSEQVKIKKNAQGGFDLRDPTCKIFGFMSWQLLSKAQTWGENYDPMFWLKELKGKAQLKRENKAKKAAWKECWESNKLLDAMEPKYFIHKILKKWVNEGADLRLIQMAYVGLVWERAGYIGAHRSMWRGNPQKQLTSAQKEYKRNKDRWSNEVKQKYEKDISDLETQVQEYRQPPPGRKGLRPDHALNGFILTVEKHLRVKTGSPHTKELTDLLESLDFSLSSPERDQPERRGVKTKQRRKREERNPRPYLEIPLN